MHHTVGLAYYRAQRLEEAKESFRYSMKLASTWTAKYLNWFAMALVEWQLGNRESAVMWHAKAMDYLGKHPLDAFHTPIDWVETQLLKREFRRLIDAKPDLVGFLGVRIMPN